MPAAWISAGVGAIGLISNLTGGGSSGSGSTSSDPSHYDPYSQYRGAAATQLNSLMADPSSATNSSYGQALQIGAQRSMASQGYTGSGNAVVAAANAGGQAYQQQFNNLAMLSGANQNPAYAQGAAAMQGNYNQQQSNQMWNQLGGLAGNVINGINGPSSNNTTGVGNDTGYYDVGGNGTGGLGMQTQTDQSGMYAPSYASTDF